MGRVLRPSAADCRALEASILVLFVETGYQKRHRSDTGPVNLRMTEI